MTMINFTSKKIIKSKNVQNALKHVKSKDIKIAPPMVGFDVGLVLVILCRISRVRLSECRKNINYFPRMGEGGGYPRRRKFCENNLFFV